MTIAVTTETDEIVTAATEIITILAIGTGTTTNDADHLVKIT
jgi:hypothetical protein